MAGRPTDYKPEYCEQVIKLCKLGATDKEIADFFEVDVSTINNWKIAHPEFFESVKEGKIKADAEVANSLHKRAVGYQYDEITFEKVDNKINLEVASSGDIKANETYKKKIVTKEIAPDPGAALNWLKNRQPEKWRDKTEVDVTSKGEQIHFYLPDNGREDNKTTEGVSGEVSQ